MRRRLADARGLPGKLLPGQLKKQANKKIYQKNRKEYLMKIRQKMLLSTTVATIGLSLALSACGGSSGSVSMSGPSGASSSSSSSSSSASSSSSSSSSSASTPAVAVKIWETTADQSKLLSAQADAALDTPAAGATNIITVDASQTFQSMVGFGAAITDASAYMLQHKMTTTQRDALMTDLFSPTALNLSFARLTIGASDFSQTDYTYDDMGAGQSDPTLSHFSIAAAKVDVIPTAKQALSLNSKLTFMASPWSAPGWMKTTDSLITGSLKPDAYSPFADYLVKYVQAMGAEGVPIFAVTLQNEPGFEPKDYPGMAVPPATRAAFIGGYLGPKFKAASLATKILDYDHNWDLPSSPTTVLADATANPYVDGIAWHCYAGDPSAQTPVHNAYPTKDAYFTECSGGSWAPAFSDGLVWDVDTLIIGTTRNWAKSVLLWNLVLDENGGPHLGGCSGCRPVVTVDSRTGAVTHNLEYYALGHASKFVRTGALRVASDTAVNGIDTVAFKNTDDSSVVLVAVNTAADTRAFTVKSGGKAFAYSLPGKAVATFVWKP